MKVQSEKSTKLRIATAPGHYRGTVEGEARFAVVVAPVNARPEQVERYLPGNYALMESFPGTWDGRERLIVVIGGTDNAGWTLDGYVIPRLLSGLYACEEIVGGIDWQRRDDLITKSLGIGPGETLRIEID